MKEKLYFFDSKGIKLCGILFNPTEDVSRPIIILCHGFTTSKDSTKCTRLEKALNENEVASFRFDFFGHGESEGDFSEITISEGVDDILRAIGYLKALGYSKIGLVGSSFGGTCAIMAASKTEDLFALALISPVSNYRERDLAIKSKEELIRWKDEGYWNYTDSKGGKRKLNYSFFEDYENNDGYEAATKINIPTLIVHGDKDESVPIEQSVKTGGILRKGKLEIIEGAGHHYAGPGQYDAMIKITSDFVVKNSLLK